MCAHAFWSWSLSPDTGSSTQTDSVEPQSKRAKGRSGKPNGKGSKAGTPKASRSRKTSESTTSASGTASLVEPLTGKRIVVGQLLMGCVKSVADFAVQISLPHGLQGTLQLSDVSPHYVAYLRGKAADAEDAEAASASEDEESEQEQEQEQQANQSSQASDEIVVSMSRLFHVGQQLVCAVKAKEDKRLLLTTDPRLIHANLDVDDILQKAHRSQTPQLLSLTLMDSRHWSPPCAHCQGRLLPACVQSVEDHGYVVDLGIDGAQGFLPTKAAKLHVKQLGRNLVPGEPLFCVTTGTTAGSTRVVQVSINISKLRTAELSTNEAVMSTLRPGLQVRGKVQQVHAKGLVLQSGGFSIGIHHVHFDQLPTEKKTTEQLYTVGQTLTARVIFIDLANKVILASLRQPHLQIDDCTLPLPIGTRLPSCHVRFVDQAFGVLAAGQPAPGHARGVPAEEDTPEVLGFAHISRLLEEHVETVPKSFRRGTAHEGRVVAQQPFDGIYSFSFAPKDLKVPFLAAESIEVGLLVQGSVLSLIPSGMVIELASGIQARVPSEHLADVMLTHPEKKFKAGDKVKGRVLSNEKLKGSKHRIKVTLKKTLVRSDLPIIKNMHDAQPGMRTHGCISKVMDKGCIVSFYNQARRLSALPLFQNNAILANRGCKFMVVECGVLNCDPQENSLILTFRAAKTSVADRGARDAQLKRIEAGSLEAVEVVAVAEDMLTVKFVESPLVQTELRAGHLTDHPSLATALCRTYKKGDKLEAVVLEKRGRRVTISCKPQLKAQTKVESLPKELDDLKLGQVFPAYIRSVLDYGCFIGTIHGLSGLVPLRQLAKRYVDNPKAFFHPDQTVLVAVSEINKEQNRAVFSMKEDVIGAVAVVPYMQSLAKDMARFAGIKDSPGRRAAPYHHGQAISVLIQEIKPFGVVGTTKDGVPIFVTKEQRQGIECEVGVELPGRVLDIDYEKGVLDVTLKPELVSASSDNGKDSKTGKGKRSHPTKLPFAKKEEVQGRVELVKVTHAVVSGPERTLLYCPTQTYNDRREPFKRFVAGSKATVTVLSVGNPEFVVGQATVQWASQRSQLALLPLYLHFCMLIVRDCFYGWKQESEPTTSELAVGQVVEAEVTKAGQTQLQLRLPEKRSGRVLATEVLDENDTSAQPFKAYHKGDKIQVRILGFRDQKTRRFMPITQKFLKRHVAECSLKPSVLAAKELPPMLEREAVEVGQERWGVVSEVGERCLWVLLAPNVRGRINLVNLGAAATDPKALKKQFGIGMRHKFRIIIMSEKLLELELASESSQEIHVGSVVSASLKRIVNRFGIMHLGHGRFGAVDITDVDDKLHAEPFKTLDRSKVYRAVVIGGENLAATGNMGSAIGDIRLSLRPSEVEGDAATKASVLRMEDVDTDQVHRGVVCNATDEGVFVALSRNVTARVQIANLSDLFVRDIKKAFKVGTLVQGRIMAKTDGRLEMSLKKSDVDPSGTTLLRIDTLEQGQHVTGVIKRVESYGVFIVIDDSANLTGMAHISECADQRIEDLNKLYSAGDAVKAVVLKVDVDKKRISLGIKPSYFDDAGLPQAMDESADEASAADGDASGDESDADADDVLDTDAVALQERGADASSDEEDEEAEDDDGDSDSDEESDAEGGGAFASASTALRDAGDALGTSTTSANPFQLMSQSLLWGSTTGGAGAGVESSSEDEDDEDD
ncbi:uncharacterized protein MONBRDRAFT_22368, partial [Monosiga brevicollis MX1]